MMIWAPPIHLLAIGLLRGTEVWPGGYSEARLEPRGGCCFQRLTFSPLFPWMWMILTCVRLDLAWGWHKICICRRTGHLDLKMECNTPFSGYIFRYVFRFFWLYFSIYFPYLFCFIIIYVIVLHWIRIRGLGVSPSLNRGPISVHRLIWSFW